MFRDLMLKLRQCFCIHHYKRVDTMYIPPMIIFDSGDNCVVTYRCVKCGRKKIKLCFDPNHLGNKVKTMKLTEKQKTCPYCHSEKPIMRALNDKTQVYIANSLKNQPLTVVYDFASEVGTNEEYIWTWKRAINYCPMCGRPLTGDDGE